MTNTNHFYNIQNTVDTTRKKTATKHCFFFNLSLTSQQQPRFFSDFSALTVEEALRFTSV